MSSSNLCVPASVTEASLDFRVPLSVTRRENAEAEAKRRTFANLQWAKEVREQDPTFGALLARMVHRVTARELLAWDAAHHGQWCGMCAEDLTDHVYRQWVPYADCTVPLCESCVSGARSYEARGRCICGKTIYITSYYTYRRYVFCCELHRRRQARARITDARRRFRKYVCASCNAKFGPARSDGRYCSPACRQKAYRQRNGGAS